MAINKNAGISRLKANVIHAKEDTYYLSFEELREVVGTNKLNKKIISRRKDEFKKTNSAACYDV